MDITGIVEHHGEDGTGDRIFGEKADIRNSGVDTYWLMRKNAEAPRKPRLYVSCGTKDFLYDAHQAFVSALKRNGWNVTRHDEPEAVHEWGFWDREIERFIEFIYNEE